MKILKILGILIVLVILAAIAMGILGPDTTHVERSMEINASKNVVYKQIADLKKMDEWGPWKKEDPNAEYTYEGEMGQVGSVSLWNGEKIGKGKQEITALESNKKIVSKLTFIEPFQAVSTGYFELSDGENGGTNVTWAFDGTNDSFMQKLMASMMDMDEQIGGMFEKGLHSLNDKCQSMTGSGDNEMANFEINETVLETKYYLGTDDTVKVAELKEYFGASFASIGEALGKAEIQMAGPPSGVYFMFDEENGITHLSAAFPISEMKEVEGFKTTEVSGKALHVAYYGSYDKLGAAHYAIDAHMKANNIEYRGPVVEEYATDPVEGSDPSEWLTNIYYPIN